MLFENLTWHAFFTNVVVCRFGPIELRIKPYLPLHAKRVFTAFDPTQAFCHFSPPDWRMLRRSRRVSSDIFFEQELMQELKKNVSLNSCKKIKL